MMAVPQDSGFSWVICFAAFCLAFSYTLTFRVSGFLVVEVAELFHESVLASTTLANVSRASAAIGSVVYPFLMRAGDKVLASVSVIMGSLSLCLGCVAPTIHVFSLTYGLFQGFGFILGFQCTVHVISVYFHKRLAVAMSIAFVGVRLAQVATPHLITLIKRYYDIRGTLLLLGGCVLQVLPACFLFRPISAFRTSPEHTEQIVVSIGVGGTEEEACEMQEKDTARREMAKQTGTEGDMEEQTSDDDATSSTNTLETVIHLDDVTDQDNKSTDDVTNSDKENTKEKDETKPEKCHNKDVTSLENAPVAKSAHTTKTTIQQLKKLVHFPFVYFLLANRAINLATFQILVVFGPSFILGIGSQSMSSVVFMLSLSGYIESASRLLCGWSMSLGIFKASTFAIVTDVLISLLILLASFLGGFAGSIIVVLTFSCLSSLSMLLSPLLVVESVGKEYSTTVLSQWSMLACVLTIILTSTFGSLYDHFGSYFLPMLITAGLQFVGFIFAICEVCLHKNID